jgi:TorA maturation chaperone TorD
MKTDVQRNRHEELTDMTETAEQRSNTYGFLALIFRTETTANMLKRIKDPEFLDALSEMGEAFEDDFLQRPEDELIEDLAVEYARLFIGPGKHISPYESVQHERDDGDWGQLWGADTVAVKKFIETAGLEYKTEYTGLPDHISVELEFMSEVIKREASAWKDNDREGALYCLKIEKKFIEEHLAGWVPVFCDKVIEQAEFSFYRGIAKLTKSFLENEQEEIDNYLMQAQG